MEYIETRWEPASSGTGRRWRTQYCAVCDCWIICARFNRHNTKSPHHLEQLSRRSNENKQVACNNKNVGNASQ